MAPHDVTEAPDLTAATALTLPRFWDGNPTLWFAQVEAKFALARITSPTTKYFHVLEALPQQVATEVQDILTMPVTATSFETLKSALLTRLVPSESTRLQHFLAPEDIGDRTASQYLRYLQSLLGAKAATTDEVLLKEVFLQHLPSNVRFGVAAWYDLPITKIASIADRLMSTVAPGIDAAFSKQGDDHTRDELLLRLSVDVAELKQQFCSRTTPVRRTLSPSVCHGQFRRSSKPHHGSPSRSRQGVVCYYHRRFRSSARKCARPCTWQAENHTARR